MRACGDGYILTERKNQRWPEAEQLLILLGYVLLERIPELICSAGSNEYFFGLVARAHTLHCVTTINAAIKNKEGDVLVSCSMRVCYK